MSKQWKDSQKSVDKLTPEFDTFCAELDKRNEVYIQLTDLTPFDSDPVLAYLKVMREKLDTYTWGKE